MTEKLETAVETARQFGINARILRQWADNGKVPAVKYGKGYRFLVSQVAQYIADLSTSNVDTEHTPHQRQRKNKPKMIHVNNQQAQDKLTHYLG